MVIRVASQTLNIILLQNDEKVQKSVANDKLFTNNKELPHMDDKKKAQLKAIKHVQELAEDYQKNRKTIEKELLELFKSYGITKCT